MCKILLSLVLVMSGCAVFDEHEGRKQLLQREIEILQLEKRKALLQRQLEFIENTELVPTLPVLPGAGIR